MKAFVNVNPKDVGQAVTLLARARTGGTRAAIAGGGSDLLGMIKEQLVAPDLLVNLKAIDGLDRMATEASGLRIGGLTTLAAIGRDATVRAQYAVLAEAAESVATPQIRNVATLAGNVCQRPWCWYFRNSFPCFKNGGTTCFAAVGENQFHAIFGGGPSHIVHPSDTAAALVALDARFRVVGPKGERTVPAAEFFVLPRQSVARENVLEPDEVLVEAQLPSPASGWRSTYAKVMDREAWTHALVSAAMVLDMDGATCRTASIVLGGVAPIPWRVAEAERLLARQRITPELATRVADAAVAGARPLAKNGYKVTMTRNLVRRALLQLAQVPA